MEHIKFGPKPHPDDGIFEYNLHQDIYHKGWYFSGHYTGKWYKNHNYGCLGIIDNEISYLVGMSIEEYQQYLIDNFNAYLKPGYGGRFTHFKTKEEAEKALEWVISAQVLQRLII